jgi:hypothetical protein
VKTDDSAGTGYRLFAEERGCRRALFLLDRSLRSLGEECREIVVKDKGSCVLGILFAALTGISGAEEALRIVGGTFANNLFLLSEPGTLGTVR